MAVSALQFSHSFPEKEVMTSFLVYIECENRTGYSKKGIGALGSGTDASVAFNLLLYCCSHQKMLVHLTDSVFSNLSLFRIKFPKILNLELDVFISVSAHFMDSK